TSTRSVSITSATTGARIYYTTDGSAPNLNSPIYNGPVAVSKTSTLKALAIAPGVAPSQTATAIYTIQTVPGGGPNYLGGFTAAGMTFNGSATLNGTRLRLNDGNGGEAGTAFFNTPVNSQYFITDFTFQLINPAADGITFCIQGDGPTALGTGGG